MITENGYWRTEYAVMEDRTDKGLGFASLWITDDLARARDHAELLLLDGCNVSVQTRKVLRTEWVPVPIAQPSNLEAQK